MSAYHMNQPDRLPPSGTSSTDAELNCNLCNYESYLNNIEQLGVDGVPIPPNEKAMRALFECKLYRSLDDSCKRILITGIRKLSHSSEANPVRMSLMAMHVQTESEADAEKLKRDMIGISLRALLDSLPSSVVRGEHETRVNDILYSLAEENRMSIRIKYAPWIRAISDPQERTILQVIYRALWFSNPYGVRNLGLRMLLQEEVPECWDAYKKKEGKTLRELLLKYRSRISGRREFLANDTLYKLKDGSNMEMPPIPQCTCNRALRYNTFDRKIFPTIDNESAVEYFRKAIREVLYNCGGDQASSILLEELKTRCNEAKTTDSESDMISGIFREKVSDGAPKEDIRNKVTYLMRYDVLCYLLSKRHADIWARMTDGNKGSRKCRKDGLVEVMKTYDDFYLVTYKVRTPIITLLDESNESEPPDLRANALPFVPSSAGGNSVNDSNHATQPPKHVTPIQQNGSVNFGPTIYDMKESITQYDIERLRQLNNNCFMESVEGGHYQPSVNETFYSDSLFSNYDNLMNGHIMDRMSNPIDINANKANQLDSYGSPRSRVQSSLKSMLGLFDKDDFSNPTGLKSGSSTTCATLQNGNLPFDTPEWTMPNSNCSRNGSYYSIADNELVSNPYSNLHYGLETTSIPLDIRAEVYNRPNSQYMQNHCKSDYKGEYYRPSSIRNFTSYFPEGINRMNKMSDNNKTAIDWILACASPLNGVYNNMDISPGTCWESMISPYIQSPRSFQTD